MFHVFAKKCAEIAGNPLVFALALLSVIIWLFCGLFFQFSNTWQLVINTITNIFEFLILFLIQNTQNRDTENIQIKLDELLRTQKKANQSIIDLDSLTDRQLKELEEKYKQISKSEDKTFKSQ